MLWHQITFTAEELNYCNLQTSRSQQELFPAASKRKTAGVHLCCTLMQSPHFRKVFSFSISLYFSLASKDHSMSINQQSTLETETGKWEVSYSVKLKEQCKMIIINGFNSFPITLVSVFLSSVDDKSLREILPSFGQDYFCVILYLLKNDIISTKSPVPCWVCLSPGSWQLRKTLPKSFLFSFLYKTASTGKFPSILVLT